MSHSPPAAIPFPPARRQPAAPAPLVEPLLRKKEAARLLGLSERSVERLITAGELPIVRLGASCRVDPLDLRRYIDQQKTVHDRQENANAAGGIAALAAIQNRPQGADPHEPTTKS